MKPQTEGVPGPLRFSPTGAAPAWGRPLIKAVILLAVMLTALWILYASPLHQQWTRIRAAPETLRQFGVLAPLIFTLVSAGLIAVGCPRLIFCPLAGLAFGFWGGLLWSQLGALLGSYLTFLFVRWGGQALVARYWPRLQRLRAFFEQRGLFSVIILRQLPISAIFINLILGVSPIRHRQFLLGTLLGNLPEAVPCILLGSGALHPTASLRTLQVGVAVVLLAAVWIGTAWYLRSSQAAARMRENVEAASDNGESA